MWHYRSTARGKNESEEFVPSFVGIRKLEDLLKNKALPDEKYLYEYSGDTLKIMQVVSSAKGVLAKYGNWRDDTIIFVEMDIRNLADEEYLPPITVQYNGIFKYKTVLKVERRVRRFKAVSKYKISESPSKSGK